MKPVASVTAAFLAVIGIAVGVMAAVWRAPPDPSTPTGVALAYMQDLQSGNCTAARALIYDLPPAEEGICGHDGTISDPSASATAAGVRVPGFTRAYLVTVSFLSEQFYGWTAYASPPSSSSPHRQTMTLLVGRRPDGTYQLDGRGQLAPPALP